MKKLSCLIIALLLMLVVVPSVHAAKLRVRKTSGGIVRSYSSVKLSRNTNSVIVTFQNLTDAKRVRYELSYIANGVPQGAMGTVQAAGLVSDSRDLYFGTCSHGVCTPHYNISNTTLVITTELTSGGTYTKRYRIKI